MSAKFYNGLKFYCLEINESPETAEQMEQEFRTKFESLGKYDQLILSGIIQDQGFEAGFRELKLVD